MWESSCSFAFKVFSSASVSADETGMDYHLHTHIHSHTRSCMYTSAWYFASVQKSDFLRTEAKRPCDGLSALFPSSQAFRKSIFHYLKPEKSAGRGQTKVGRSLVGRMAVPTSSKTGWGSPEFPAPFPNCVGEPELQTSRLLLAASLKASGRPNEKVEKGRVGPSLSPISGPPTS